MNDWSYLILACFAGMLLGVVFFGGLWWTVRKFMTSPHPAIWLLGSAMIRMSISLAGFYFVSDGKWTRLLSCLVGFMIARLVVTRLCRLTIAEPCRAMRESNHAS